MKFHWGHASALIFGSFAFFCLFQVYQSTKQDRSLVKEDYYIDDMELEALMRKRENAMNVSGLNIEETTDRISVIIPSTSKIEGIIQLASPSNSKEDVSFPLIMNNDTMIIDARNMRNGKWNITMEWKDAIKSYSYTESILLP